MVDGLLAAVLGVVNGSWATRLEVKQVGLKNRVDGIEKVADERHEESLARLERIENKVDRLLERR